MHNKHDENKIINQQNNHDAGGLNVQDPLAAIKAIRLEQLAQCLLKTQKEIQQMQNKK
ncbi:MULTISPECIES: hypothetical protein [Pseudoalteromonas]|jgi:hypothetical protein|uniref:hypothetical protein n=1 Tax=Pseudoalteromonas TaxID=53246 RepID=UPI00051D67E8|nr:MULTISPECIES: hypothetical protein [unclassified Pseudoalteromonas]KGK01307.1 hypothetical protein ND6B_1832 [Pseudoalteromonas sp. ND6B]SFT39138.1 hypothetical protein SAMN04487870_0261 [Pseudoalteromonas sp. DSM 26666]